MKALTTRMRMAMERTWTDDEGIVRVDNSTLMQTVRGLQARGLVAPYSHVLTTEGLKWRDAASLVDGLVRKTGTVTGRIPAKLCSHGIALGRCSVCREDAELGTIEETDGRCSFGNIHAIETCQGCGTEDEQGNQVEPKVQIHTAGELHPAPKMPAPDFVFNLSRLLDDPAHKPGAELINLDGTDSRVQDFVFATDGALDTYWAAVSLIEDQTRRGKSATVLVLCRGGKHRSVAFGDNLAAHFSVEAVHHHKHLPRVVTLGADQRPRCGVEMPAYVGGPVPRVCNLTLNADGECPDVNHKPSRPDSDYARELAEALIAVQKQRHELRCALAHLVGSWGVGAADKPYAEALDDVLKSHR